MAADDHAERIERRRRAADGAHVRIEQEALGLKVSAGVDRRRAVGAQGVELAVGEDEIAGGPARAVMRERQALGLDGGVRVGEEAQVDLARGGRPYDDPAGGSLRVHPASETTPSSTMNVDVRAAHHAGC